MVLVLTSAFFVYISVTIELSAITMAMSHFNWTIAKLSLVVTICTTVYLVVFLLSGRRMFRSISVTYMIYILGFVVFWVILLTLILPVLIPEMFKSEVSQYLLIGMAIFCKFFFGISSQTSGRCLTFYLVPDHSASFADGFRNSTARTFLWAGFLFAAYLYSKAIYIYVFPIFCCILFICIVLLLLRRQVFF